MKKVFKDVIEIKITLDTDDLKSICDAMAKVNPHTHVKKEDFFDMVMEEIIRDLFSGYTWYKDDMCTFEVEEICPTIVEKIAEYIDWYIVRYYLKEDFKWSD